MTHPSTTLPDRIDALLAPWKSTIGADFDGYRNHCVRMALLCNALSPCDEEACRKIAIAACFHDIGLWTAQTLDYLPPSLPPARRYLRENGLEHWTEEICLMISEHHKLRAYRDARYPLVELFRKADLVDFSLGTARFGLGKGVVKSLQAEYPNAGFHKTLVRLASAWFLRHPLNPAPMMKW